MEAWKLSSQLSVSISAHVNLHQSGWRQPPVWFSPFAEHEWRNCPLLHFWQFWHFWVWFCEDVDQHHTRRLSWTLVFCFERGVWRSHNWVAEGKSPADWRSRETKMEAVCSSCKRQPPDGGKMEAGLVAGSGVLPSRLGRYVRLNVGGSLFYTTLDTLTKKDTMLRAMFSGEVAVITDEQGKQPQICNIHNYPLSS